MSTFLKLTICILIFLFIIHISTCTPDETTTSSGVFGKLKHGLHMASKVLGLGHASEVAQLVAQAFHKTQKKGEDSGGTNIFSGFLRVLGFDTKKIGAIAVNAIIFFAQLISTSLTVNKPSQLTHAKELKDGTPFDWMLNNSRVQDIISHAKDKDLPDRLIMYIKERSLDEETDCVQLLVCKGAPVIWSMQKALELGQNKTKTDIKGLMALLPSVDEIADHGEKCEKKHPYCFTDL